MKKLLEMAEKMGLSGEELREFVSEQQALEREQRTQDTERVREHEIQEIEARMKHEPDLEIEVAAASHKASKSGDVMSKGSKLPK